MRGWLAVAAAGGILAACSLGALDGFSGGPNDIVDAGPDTIMGHKPAGLLLCRELGLEDRLVKPLMPRTLYVVRRGQLRALPDASMLGFPTSMRSLVTTTAFGWGGKVRMAGEMLVPARPKTDDDESIASFVGRRFGAHAVSYLAETLLAGIHGGDASRLSMQALIPIFLPPNGRTAACSARS